MLKLIRYASFSLLFLVSTSSHARWLEWKLLDVEATIQANGSMRVREDHHMIFDGDWNGGERSFHIRKGQEFLFHEMSRLQDGQWIPMNEGNLQRVDQYGWFDGNVLRWRARLPSDPPFRARPLTYRIEYTLRNILKAQGEHYLLNHDFAFPNRQYEIRNVRVRLNLEAPWASTELQPTYESGRLNWDSGFVIQGRLNYESDTPPAFLDTGEGTRHAWFIFYGAAALILISILQYIRDQQRLGRFRRYLPYEKITPAWLEEQVFRYPPEQVGVEWDGEVGKAEVAAVLARWAQEGRIKIETQKKGWWIFSQDKTTLRLLVPRDRFTTLTETTLLEYFFFQGRTATTMEDLIHEYRFSTSSPADRIRRTLKVGSSGTSLPHSVGFIQAALGMLFGFFSIPFMLEWLASSFPIEWVIPGFILSVLCGIATLVIAHHAFRSRFGASAALLPPLLCLPPLGILAYLLSLSDEVWIPAALGAAFPCIIWTRVLLGVCKMRLLPAAAERRWILGSARRYFARELGKKAPLLQDRHAPYLIALELNRLLTSWNRRFGRSISSTSTLSSEPTFSRTHSSVSGSSAWSGGAGGTFAGGGASGTWVAAVGGMAAGYTRPSSSSSSGSSSSSSSSSGGSSSGGGGGGGW